jgi:ubiquinone/menaquinone biosynthesis C-methylase UbiE
MAWVIDPAGDETAALAKIVDFGGLRVLEVGAGDGRLTWRYAAQAAKVLAVDPDEERIAQARADLPPELASRVRLEVMDAVELDVRPASFDLAFFSWSF